MSSGRPPGLPDFDNPPVIEVVLSLQFEPIPGWTSAHAGRLACALGDKFPLLEEHPPLQPVLEQFGPPSPPATAVTPERAPAANRIWLLNHANDELLQLQSDRFIRNWRKLASGSVYPHYEMLRDQFVTEAQHFEDFLEREKLGAIRINQCEVAYINHVELDGPAHADALQRVVTGPFAWPTGGYLPKPQDVALNARFEMPLSRGGTPAGRLHLATQSLWRRSDSKPLLGLTLTARGAPLGPGLDGAVGFLNLGREWIVNGFKAVTTSQMHEIWRIKHD